MLSKNQVELVRKSIEKTYIDTCTISEMESYKKANKATGHKEVISLENQPCKLSFSSITSTNQTETASQVIQITKLFISPEIEIKPGSKLKVTQRSGLVTELKRSGKPAVYDTHQEVILQAFEGWA